MKQTRKLQKLFIGFGALAAIFILSQTAFSQGKQAVVVMRQGGATAVAACEGTTQINYQLVSDLKLNNKDEIRLVSFSANEGLSPDSTSVSRKLYEDAAKNKLANMYQLKWQNNILVAVAGNGQTPLLVLPDDMKPQKNLDSPLSSFYSAMLSGEAREGKRKTKASIALRDVWKIFLMPDGGNVNDFLFAHAAEEKSVVIWEAFLQKTSNYRAAEANSNMKAALVGCAGTALDQFKNGNYQALETARQRIVRAQSVGNDAETDKFLTEINQQQQRVNNAKEQVYQHIAGSRFDEAIAAAEPIKMYLSSWSDLNSLYKDALQRSHDQHLSKGKQALQGNQLDAALAECSTAWQRLSESNEAHGCVCLSRNRVALRDSTNYRQRKQPKLAKELLEKQLADADCSRDEAVLSELNVAKREYSQQLFLEAKQLVGGGGAAAVVAKTSTGRKSAAPKAGLASGGGGGFKAVTAQNKKDFRAAREKLQLAQEMSPDENAGALLDKVNQNLADYCVTEARKALQRNDSGTAYVYLTSAQHYTPQNNSVHELLNQARTQFEDKTRVNIGVVFTNSARAGNSEAVLNEISSEIESVTTRVGLAQPVILDRNQSVNALRAIQNGTNLSSPTAIFSGDLLGANVSVNHADRSVRSYYLEDNPEYKRRDQIHDGKVDEYKSCKRQSGEAACVGLKGEMEELKRWRNSVESQLKNYYDYYERYYKVAGGARLSFRYADSISRSVLAAETLAAAVADECVARSNVDARDRSASNNDCNRIQDESVYMNRMSSQLRSDASIRASALLRDLPFSYYKRAKTSVNRQQAVEDYLRFLFLTGAKTGAEAEDAKRFLLDFDAELKTDGVLR